MRRMLLPIGMIVAGLLAASEIQASVVTYTLTVAGGHSATFSYDDANTTTVSVPPPLNPVGSFYEAISFTVDGAPVASPIMGIYDNLLGIYDCILATSTMLAGTTAVELCANPPTLFSGQALSAANGHPLSDFTAGAILVISGVGPYEVLTLTSTVPEPATFGLLGIGLAGFGFLRRKR